MVLFFPRGTSEQILREWLTVSFPPEAQYERQGLIRLEVIPRNYEPFGGATADLEAFRRLTAAALNTEGESFTIEDLSLAKPAFRVHVTAPLPLIQTVIEGEKVMYMFTSAPGNQALESIVTNLSELMPHDDPGQ